MDQERPHGFQIAKACTNTLCDYKCKQTNLGFPGVLYQTKWIEAQKETKLPQISKKHQNKAQRFGYHQCCRYPQCSLVQELQSTLDSRGAVKQFELKKRKRSVLTVAFPSFTLSSFVSFSLPASHALKHVPLIALAASERGREQAREGRTWTLLIARALLCRLSFEATMALAFRCQQLQKDVSTYACTRELFFISISALFSLTPFSLPASC